MVAGTEYRLTSTSILSYEAALDEQVKQAMVQIAKLIKIRTGTEPPVVVRTFKCGLLSTKQMQTAKLTQSTLVAQDIYTIPTNVPL